MLIFGISTFSLYHEKWPILIVIDRALVFVRVALLMFFAVLMLVMGRVWTRYELGIAFGFGALSASSFLSSALWTRAIFGSFAGNLPLISWNTACLIWLICFGKAKLATEAATTSESLDPALLRDARTWEDTLKSWLAPKKK